MNLFELEKEQRLLEAKIKSQEERIELEQLQLSKEKKQDEEYLKKKLEQNKKDVDRLYNIYNNYSERNKQIYIEKKFYKWSNAKISAKHNGITDRQIRRIIKKIENMC